LNQFPNHFADRLVAAVRRCRNPVLVGLDPRAENLPRPLLAGQAGQDLPGAYQRFCREVIDVVAPLAPAVKPQSAFFEQLGPRGMSALAATIAYAREKGLLVILDGKRNDIGSTALAYAQAYLGPGAGSPWGADALTVNPYLGDDSLRPFVEVAWQRGGGVFVLVKTSNPGGAMFQNLPAGGRPLYRHVADHVEKLAQETAGDSAYGAVGAVVGATHPQELAELRCVMPHAWFLVPGYGAQGARAQDVAAAFDPQGLGAVINSSRAIIFAHERGEYREKFGESRWQEAVQCATRDMIDQLRDETPAGRLNSA
jgi:orotidine-5'-phosphate decarboxylase